MNKQEVLEIIKDEVVGSGLDPEYDADFSKLKEAGFKIETEEQIGGEEQGSEYHVVLKLESEKETFFVKCDGYYQSYEGTNWSDGDVYETQPKMVEVRKWTDK